MHLRVTPFTAYFGLVAERNPDQCQVPEMLLQLEIGSWAIEASCDLLGGTQAIFSTLW